MITIFQKNKITHYFLALVFILGVAGGGGIPILSRAAEDPTGACARLDKQFQSLDTPPGTIATNPESATANFPRICSIGIAVTKVTNLLFSFVGAAAVLFIILGGFQLMTSSGNQEMAEKGKKTLIYAVIGLIVVILAALIVRLVVNLLVS